MTGNTALRIQRKRPRVDAAIDSMVAKLIKHDEAAEKRYIEFEERRMKAEQEAEEKRQLRDQKHEMDMQRMFFEFVQQMNRPYPSIPYEPNHYTDDFTSP